MFAQLLKLRRRGTSNPGEAPSARRHFLARAAMKYHRLVDQMDWLWRGYVGNQAWPASKVDRQPAHLENPLRAYFDAHREGPGLWKWLHYFDIYDRHFAKFRGREVHVLEIGIYSGGSLAMWKDYFGAEGRIYGVDIEEACRAYEDDVTKVFIGDQADRQFWRNKSTTIATRMTASRRVLKTSRTLSVMNGVVS